MLFRLKNGAEKRDALTDIKSLINPLSNASKFFGRDSSYFKEGKPRFAFGCHGARLSQVPFSSRV